MASKHRTHSDRIVVDLELVQRLEQIENNVYFDLYSAASSEVKELLGLQILRSRRVVATLASESDVYALNRVGGLGVFEEVNEHWLEAMLHELRDSQVNRIFVNEVPVGVDRQLVAKLERAGLQHYNNWVKLYRDCNLAPSANCDLGIDEISDAHAADFGRIFASAAGWPGAAADWLAGLVGRPDWYTFGAFDGRRLVATSALFVHDRTGAMTFAATHPDYRGRGVQSALIERRIELAASLGCDLLSVETGQDRPGHSIPSYRNVVRCGFKQAYVRGNYVWRNAAN